ncbi:MAG: M48 family metalloprotease [Bacteroidota bacterium]
MMMKRYSRSWNLLFIAATLLLSLACARNPVTGKKEFMLMSVAQEKALGASYDPQVVRQFGVYDDQRLQSFISSRGQDMARVSHRAQLPFQFRIVDSPVVNAFAVPGGYVYFTRGIMAHFNNEAEFAGVLGHEIGHVTARHSARQYSQQMLAQLGFVVGVAVSEDFRQYADLASAGLQLLFMQFSRSHESQSDKLGVEYSTAVGYDAHEMANFFRTIQRLQAQSGASIPTILSTHPDPGDRYNRVHQLALKAQSSKKRSNLKTNRNSYLRMIDGIVYGEDPNQGYVEGGRFYHPELRFQFPVPGGWQVVNTPAQVEMAPREGHVAVVFTLSGQQSLAAAEQEAIQANNLQVLSSNRVSVGGNQALETIADLNAEVRLQMLHIQYDGRIYRFTGLAQQQLFGRYQSTFDNTFRGFRSLQDPSKINREPERVRVKEVKQSGTFRSVMSSFNMPSNRHQELAILNGMELNEQVQKGTLIKVVERGSAPPRRSSPRIKIRN